MANARSMSQPLIERHSLRNLPAVRWAEANFDLLLTLGASLLQVGLVLGGYSGLPRIALGFLFVTFLPGYTLLCAAYGPYREQDPLERVGLALGVSLAVGALSGLLLDQFGWSVPPEAHVLWMGSSVCLFSIAGLARRRLLEPQAALHPASRDAENGAGLALVLVLVCTTMALGLVGMSLVPQKADSSVSLYLLDPSQTIKDLSRPVEAGKPVTIGVGVTYQGDDAGDFELRGPRGEVTSLHVAPGEAWSREVRVVPEKGEGSLTWDLYRPGSTEPVRSVHLWVRPEEQ